MEQTYPVLPLRNFVMFPGLLTTIQTADPYVGRLLNELDHLNKKFLVSLMIKDDEYFYQTACLVLMEELETVDASTFQITIRGLDKFFVDHCPLSDPIMVGKGKIIRDYVMDEDQAHDDSMRLSKLIKRYIFLTQAKPEAMLQAVSFITDPAVLSNFCCHYFLESPYEKQEYLQILNINRRLQKVANNLEDLVEDKVQEHSQTSQLF
ncbi:MAG: LON peptidase substrate-binding domain-containing protein [bacterium]|nr:LON peptidase substrate-binding domain-containing protein [bacterium]